MTDADMIEQRSSEKLRGRERRSRNLSTKLTAGIAMTKMATIPTITATSVPESSNCSMPPEARLLEAANTAFTLL